MGTRGRVVVRALVLVFAAVLQPLAVRRAAAQANGDTMIPGCGICYPGGYDLNTFGSVDGRIIDLEVPEEGPVRLVVAAQTERWVVLASPAWFWRRAVPQPAVGDRVTVRGSKTLGADGVLYIVAGEIRREQDNAVLLLRDRSGYPLWRGGRRRQSAGGRGPTRELTRAAGDWPAATVPRGRLR